MYPSPAPQGLLVPRYLARFGMSRETYNLMLLEREKEKAKEKAKEALP